MTPTRTEEELRSEIMEGVRKDHDLAHAVKPFYVGKAKVAHAADRIGQFFASPI